MTEMRPGLVTLFAVSLSALGVFSPTSSSLKAMEPKNAEVDDKFSKERANELLGKVINGKASITASERNEIADLTTSDQISDQHRNSLLAILYFSMRDSEDRSRQAKPLLPRLTKLIDSEPAEESYTNCLGCIAFAFEDADEGAKLEQKWFARLRPQAQWKQRALVTALGSTKWSAPQERFERFLDIYRDEATDHATRESIIDAIYIGMTAGGLNLRDGSGFYGDLAKLPVHSPVLTQRMFSRLSEFGEMIRVLSQFREYQKGRDLQAKD